MACKAIRTLLFCKWNRSAWFAQLNQSRPTDRDIQLRPRFYVIILRDSTQFNLVNFVVSVASWLFGRSDIYTFASFSFSKNSATRTYKGRRNRVPGPHGLSRLLDDVAKVAPPFRSVVQHRWYKTNQIAMQKLRWLWPSWQLLSLWYGSYMYILQYCNAVPMHFVLLKYKLTVFYGVFLSLFFLPITPRGMPRAF